MITKKEIQSLESQAHEIPVPLFLKSVPLPEPTDADTPYHRFLYLLAQTMPPGKVRVISYLSRIVCPIGTATSSLDVGYAAYTKQDGTAAAAVGDAFIADADVGGGAIDSAFLLPTAAEFLEFDSQNGFDIVCSFEIANSPASGSLYCMVAYQQGN